MTQDPFQKFRYGFSRTRISQLKTWQLVLILITGLSAALTLIAVAATAFLIIFPAVLLFVVIGALIARWKGARTVKTSSSYTSGQEDHIIDAEYIVIRDSRNDKNP